MPGWKQLAILGQRVGPKLVAARLGDGFVRPAYLTQVIRQHLATAASSSTSNEHVIVALGGNALLKRGEQLTMENQRQNILGGVASLKSIITQYRGVTLVHGNGPQSGLLVLESAAYEKATGLPQMSLDVIDAETEGMIGYGLEQALAPHIPPGRAMATLLSQIVVDKNDTAFSNPTKFIGPIMTEEEAIQTGLPYKADGKHFRRVVPSPLPLQMLPCEMNALKVLTEAGCIVICAGGGGIPVVHDAETGEYRGVEAVIDKDRAATMVGAALGADGLIILTDVTAVALQYNTPQQKWIRAVSPGKLAKLMDQFPDGSMGPKCASAIEFVERTGGWAAIGSLQEASGILQGYQGTRIEHRPDGSDFIEFYDNHELSHLDDHGHAA
mmetsp:Transcript_9298/g.17740  ORF Transcript_9298/g.17740 Transcript_9298/m.17740 type:complete len:384 (-) Transcript_9298:81-1232(-)